MHVRKYFMNFPHYFTCNVVSPGLMLAKLGGILFKHFNLLSNTTPSTLFSLISRKQVERISVATKINCRWFPAQHTSPGVAKMASHAIFQYNVLVIDIDNTTLGLI